MSAANEIRSVIVLLGVCIALLASGASARAGQLKESPDWQVKLVVSQNGSIRTILWKASGSHLRKFVGHGSREMKISKPYLDHLRDQVSKLSVGPEQVSCAQYAEFKSTLGTRKICAPALGEDSRAVTLLSRLRKIGQERSITR